MGGVVCEKPTLIYEFVSICDESGSDRSVLTMRTFWLLVLYGARRLCPLLVYRAKFDFQALKSNSSAWGHDATYVGESGGRHCDGFPGSSVMRICEGV